MDERFTKALNLSYFYLKFRPRTEKEITEYLRKKAKRFKFDEAIIKKTLQSLKEDSLVDDRKFIEWFVEQKAARRPRSVFLMQRQLVKHGVDKQMIEKYFEDHKINEEETARLAVSSRFARWKSLAKEKRFQKVASFLSRRGFNYDIIKKTIAKLEDKDI